MKVDVNILRLEAIPALYFLNFCRE